MPKLVKNGELTAHSWVALRTENDVNSTDLNQGQWLVPAEQFETIAQAHPNAQLGVLASPATDPEQLKTISESVEIVAIDFPAFMDGRGFSLARTVREYADFAGEIRAVGHFIHDQIFYLSRCGFNSFEFNDETTIETVQAFLSSFSESYQAGTDEPQPLFRRRS